MYITRGSLMNNYITKKEQEITMFSNRGSGLKPKTCNQKLTLHHAQEVAKNKNGKCLSEKYKNVDTKLKWECEFGHQWEATLYNVRKIGSWCPECAGVAKSGMNQYNILTILGALNYIYELITHDTSLANKFEISGQDLLTRD